MNIAKSLPELIGNTPMVSLLRYSAACGLKTPIVAKLESFNPLSSVKDRVGHALILDAEARGALKPGGTIIESTSGNTGVALAFVAASRGYRLILTMPDSMSAERRALLKALGAELVLTPGAQGMQGAVDKAEALLAEIPGAIMARQFENPANPAVHKVTTAEEIWRDTDGAVDVFVAGVGTGGTISGVGAALKAKKPGLRVVAVEPAASPLLNGGTAGPHPIQGIGANFIPENLDRSVYDEVIDVSGDEAIAACRTVAQTEGILCGFSSGAALNAARILAGRPENENKLIVALLPDTGERYLSTGLFGE